MNGMNEPVEQTSTQRKSALIAVIVLALVIAAALVAYGILSSSQSGSTSSGSAQAYDLSSKSGTAEEARTLACVVNNPSGQDMKLATISDGKPLVVNVWATWCPHCVAEMNDFQTLFDQYGEKIQFVMLNACDTQQEISASRDYLAEHGYTFPVYYDVGHQVTGLFGITALPTTLIISPNGDLLLQKVGRIGYSAMDATLSSLV